LSCVSLHAPNACRQLLSTAGHHVRYEFELRLRQHEQHIFKLESERRKLDEIAKRIESLGTIAPGSTPRTPQPGAQSRACSSCSSRAWCFLLLLMLVTLLSMQWMN